MTNLRKAATAVLVRDTAEGLETLLLKRSSHGFFGKLWVFPGGAVDDDDALDAEHEIAAAQVAAARECMEEAGLSLDPSDMLPFAHWTPPESLPKRFATWFFVCSDGAEQAVNIDDHEIVEFRWLKPSHALALHIAGEMPLAPPGVITLTELKGLGSVTAVKDFYRQRGVFIYLPKIGFKQDKELLMLYNGDAGYEHNEPETVGGRNRLLVKDGICSYETSLL